MAVENFEEGKRYRLSYDGTSITAVCFEVREKWADGDGEGGQVDDLPFIPGDHPFYAEDGETRNPLGLFYAEQPWPCIFQPPDTTLKAGGIVCTAIPEHAELIED